MERLDPWREESKGERGGNVRKIKPTHKMTFKTWRERLQSVGQTKAGTFILYASSSVKQESPFT